MNAAPTPLDFSPWQEAIASYARAASPAYETVEVRCQVEQNVLRATASHAADAAIAPDALFDTLTRAVALACQRFPSLDRLYLSLQISGDRTPYATRELPFPSPHAPETMPGNLSEPARRPFYARPWSLSFKLSILALGSVLGFALYLLTRPCAIGSCPPLERAEVLMDEYEDAIAAAKKPQTIVRARDRLRQAYELLDRVPSWSGRAETAGRLRAAYETERIQVEKVADIFLQAHRNAVAAQNPPHAVEVWQAIAKSWSDVLVRLQQVPEDFPAQALVASKISEYRRNLQAIERQAELEHGAAHRIERATSLAAMAEAQESVAGSWESWQEVADKWSDAIEELRRVPKTVSAFPKAQEILDIYRPRLIAANDRQEQELRGLRFYEAALEAADLASDSEEEDQWFQAAVYWRQALEATSRIPLQTSYHDRGVPLVDAYQEALESAQNQARLKDTLQQAQKVLAQTCGGTQRACLYKVTPELIVVQLNDKYVDRLRATVLLAGAEGKPQVVQRAEAQIRKLQADLESVSETTQLPIAVYDADGTQIDIYNPSS